MDFTLAFNCSRPSFDQVIIRQFSSDDMSHQDSVIISRDDLKAQVVDGFIAEESVLNTLGIGTKYYPVRLATEFNLTSESFAKLDYVNAKNIFDKMVESWILQNNLSLVEEIFKIQQHLISLWPNDRSGFFEELWFVLRSNLAAKNLIIIYNDIVKSKNEHEKNKLIRVKVRGEQLPELASVNEMDEMVFKNYEKSFGNIFEITDYNKEKGQLVICASVKKSPIFIMANIFQLTRLQRAVLQSLFQGLNL